MDGRLPCYQRMAAYFLQCLLICWSAVGRHDRPRLQHTIGIHLACASAALFRGACLHQSSRAALLVLQLSFWGAHVVIAVSPHRCMQ